VALIDDSTESMVSIGGGLNSRGKSGARREDTRTSEKASEIIGPSRLIGTKNIREVLIKDKPVRSIGLILKFIRRNIITTVVGM
jgi:hypothetical protein